MSTGFTHRYKGKANFNPATLWVGGAPLFGSASVQNLTLAGSSISIGAVNNFGITSINATSMIAVARLAKPGYVGQWKTIHLNPVSSGVFITTSTDGSVTLNGSSINTTFKSTQTSIIELSALSTTTWLINGIFPGSTTATSILTLSTST